ncbi:uncharacterized protein LOC105761747 isoform X5 [Gossypium raimondii]|uniref:uncharacterized protein LOC105761747 isoform X5 n=1 Tax=Gossypium raimondii TaxID=29730 RepID=UPI00227C71A0|nr:uncharacterized protein LOC105761747 isoform X5 [Gossypium raimondii]
MSLVNSPSSDAFHVPGNIVNDSMPPATNPIYQVEEIPSENYLTPSASNFDPNMTHASIMNTPSMLTPHGVTPATNSMNFQEREFSVGNLQSPMMTHASIMNTPSMLTPHGVTPATNSMNFQEREFSVGNLQSPMMTHASIMNTPSMLTPHGVTPATNSMNFQEREFSVGNLQSRMMTHASIMNTPSMLTPHGVGPTTNSMNFQEREFSVGNLQSRMMIRANMSIASTSSHEAISEGQVNYSNQESEGLLNRNQMNDSKRSIGIKRSLDAREKGTEEQCNFHQSLEPKNKKLTLEQLGEKDEKQINKIMTDRLNRQLEQDKKSDMELVHTKQWPARQDVEEIRQDCKEIAKKYGLKTPGAKQRLLEVASKLEIKQKAREDSENPFTNMDHIVNNLGLYFDGRFIEAVKEKFSLDLGNGHSAMSPPLPSAFNDLKNQVYVQGNKQVEPEDFQGLPEELKKLRWGEIPSYLQPIASQIVKDFAKVEFSHTTALVLFCAAVKEMEDFSAEKLDLDTLKKWEATLKKAKEVGFQVGFADDLLRKNLLAYFAHTHILGGG